MTKKVMNVLYIIAMVLLIIGGLNWGIVGVIGTDVIFKYIGSLAASILYILIGLSAILVISKLFMKQKK